MKTKTFIFVAAAIACSLLFVGCLPMEGLDFTAATNTPPTVPFLTNLSGQGFSPATAMTMIGDVAITEVDSAGTFYRINTATNKLQSKLAGTGTAWTDFPSVASPILASFFCVEHAASGDKIHVFYSVYSAGWTQTYGTYDTSGTVVDPSVDVTGKTGIYSVLSQVGPYKMRIRKAPDASWYFFNVGSTETYYSFHISADFATSYNSPFIGLSASNFPGFKSYDNPDYGDLVIRSDGELWVSVSKTGNENQGFAVLNADGSFNRYVGGGNAFADPWGFDFDSSGNLYVYSRKRHVVEVYSGTSILARVDHVGTELWSSVVAGTLTGLGPQALVSVVGSKVYALNADYADAYSTYGN